MISAFQGALQQKTKKTPPSGRSRTQLTRGDQGGNHTRYNDSITIRLCSRLVTRAHAAVSHSKRQKPRSRKVGVQGLTPGAMCWTQWPYFPTGATLYICLKPAYASMLDLVSYCTYHEHSYISDPEFCCLDARGSYAPALLHDPADETPDMPWLPKPGGSTETKPPKR